MQTAGKVVLITGGGSGIGMETARLFVQKGNQVIITGRSKEKLEKAAAQIGAAGYFSCDVTSEQDVQALLQYITAQYGKLDFLMNNAGLSYLHQLHDDTETFLNASREMTTNYLAAVNITAKFLPLLKAQPEAGIINMSSITGFVPAFTLPTYSASKAALHSYSQSLRHSLAQATNIKVFEVMPSLVDTEFTRDIPTKEKITPEEVATATLDGIENDLYEIHVGTTGALHQHFFSQAEQAFKTLNRIN